MRNYFFSFFILLVLGVNAQVDDVKLWEPEFYGKNDPAKELIANRSENSKHFIKDDGDVEAFFASGPIHYKENGEWKTIFQSITPSSNGFENIHNSFKTYYPATSDGKIKTVLSDGSTFSDMINMKMYFQTNQSEVQSRNISSKSGNAQRNVLLYNNVYGNGIDLRLSQQTTKREMDYIINNVEALGSIPSGATHLVFEESVELPANWTSSLIKNKILIFDNGGHIRFSYDNPYMYDTPKESNNANSSEAVVATIDNISSKEAREKADKIRDEAEYEIVQNGNLLTIKTKVAIDWLLSPERNYPLTIDPTVNVTPNSADNWMRSVYDDGVEEEDPGFFGYVYEYWLRTHIKFNISSIPQNSVVSSAVGFINIWGAYGDIDLNTNQWQFANSADPTTTANGLALFNSVTLGYSDISAIDAGWISSNFYNPEGNQYMEAAIASGNLSLSVIPIGSYMPTAYYAFEDHTSADKPYITIVYSDPATPPICATPIAPANNATEIGHQGYVLWEAVAGATSYDVYFGPSNPPSSVATDLTDNFHTIFDCMEPEHTYYWQVVPKNANGAATGCPVWQFTTDNKLHIYATDWEIATEGFFGTSGESVDGWYANNISGETVNVGGVNYEVHNIWTVGGGPHAISGKSAGVSGLLDWGLAQDHFDYWTDLGILYRMIYRPISLEGFRDIDLEFRWKCGGESGQDFGQVISSIDNGATWLTDETGGLTNDGKYWNSPTTVRTQSLTFPPTRDNNSNFRLAFKWNDLSGNGSGEMPSFVVDDIKLRGCPFEGVIYSDKVAPNIFEWEPPTANTSTMLHIEGTHVCAQYQWEISTDATNWTNIAGANANSYTTADNLTETTYYRCKVYFGTGCTGVYQDSPFKIEIDNSIIAPVGTKLPNLETVCEGTMLTLENIIPGYGGTGTCEDQYRYSVDGGITYTAWSSDVPNFAAVVGVNIIQTRRFCSGDESPYNSYQWTVVAQPTLTNPEDKTICFGESTQLSSVLNGGTGTQNALWEFSADGTTNWTTVANGIPQNAIYSGIDSDNLSISGDIPVGEYFYRRNLETNENLCEATSTTAKLTVLLTPTVSVNSPEICSGNTTQITASVNPDGTYNYSWTVPATVTNPGNVSSFTASVEGDYTVVISGTDICSATATGTLSFGTDIEPTFNDFGPYCLNETPDDLPTTSLNGITGTWTPASINTSADGTFQFEFVADGGQCAVNKTITIEVLESITPIFQSFGPYCQGDTPDILPTVSDNTISGTWTPETIDTDNIGTVDYLFTVAGGQCANDTIIKITVNENPTVEVNSETVCEGTSVEIAATASPDGTYSYTWSVPAGFENPGNVQSFNTDVGGTYTVVVSNDNGCEATASGTVTLTEATMPSFDSFGPYCVDDIADNLPNTSNNGIAGVWQPASIDTSVEGDTEFIFTPNAGQCAKTYQTNIIVHPNPSVVISIPSVCEKVEVEIKAIASPQGTYNYSWTTPAGVNDPGNVSTFMSDVEGSYTVLVTNENNCSATATEILTYDEAMPLVFHNVFTPNNDGINDTWEIDNIELYPDNEIVVINRWGNEVLNISGYTNNWDGSGLAEGTYFYTAKVYVCGEWKQYKGYVTILR